ASHAAEAGIDGPPVAPLRHRRDLAEGLDPDQEAAETDHRAAAERRTADALDPSAIDRQHGRPGAERDEQVAIGQPDALRRRYQRGAARPRLELPDVLDRDACDLAADPLRA